MLVTLPTNSPPLVGLSAALLGVEDDLAAAAGEVELGGRPGAFLHRLAVEVLEVDRQLARTRLDLHIADLIHRRARHRYALGRIRLVDLAVDVCRCAGAVVPVQLLLPGRGRRRPGA